MNYCFFFFKEIPCTALFINSAFILKMGGERKSETVKQHGVFSTLNEFKYLEKYMLHILSIHPGFFMLSVDICLKEICFYIKWDWFMCFLAVEFYFYKKKRKPQKFKFETLQPKLDYSQLFFAFYSY